MTGHRATFSTISNTAFVVAVAVYLLAVGLHFAGLAWRSGRIRSAAVAVTAAGAVVHLVALVARAVAAGRVPWGNMYEFSMSSAWVMVVSYLAAAGKFESPQIGGFVLSGTAVWMAVGWVLYAEPGPLQPALRSNWLIFHVFLVMTGAGMLLLSAVVSALYLVRRAWEERHGLLPGTAGALDVEVPERVFEVGDSGIISGSGAAESGEAMGLAVRPEGPGAMLARDRSSVPPGVIARLPSSDKLDLLAYRLVMVAFPIWTLGVIAGAIWGEQAWGRYWGWDPKEVWSFIVWVIFATYLHARATRGWRGKGAAYLALVGGAAIIFNTFAVNLWISGLHSYAGV